MSDDSVSQLKPAPESTHEPITDALEFTKHLAWRAMEKLRAREANFDDAKEALEDATQDVDRIQREYLAMSERLHAQDKHGGLLATEQ